MYILACPLTIIEAGLCRAGSCDSIIRDFPLKIIGSGFIPESVRAIAVSAAIVVCIGDAAVLGAAVVDNAGCVPTAVESNEGGVIAVAGNVVVVVAVVADTAMRTAGIVGWS